MRAQLTMDTERNFANIDRRLNGGDGQSLQHFISNSPWSGHSVFAQIQQEITATSALTAGGTLILDESADEKAGDHNAGAARQYNGRMGKVDMCRVDTCLVYANVDARLWTMVDGELFIPEEWFGDEYGERRRELGIPQQRQFATKLELGLKMIKRAKSNGLPFELVACDTLYGRDWQFRADVDAQAVQYAAQVPATTRVYLREPRVGVPTKRGRMGRPRTRSKVISRGKPIEVRDLTKSYQTEWQRVGWRHSERGWLEADFAIYKVWSVGKEKQSVRSEWLVMRREEDGACSYTMLNSASDTPRQVLIERSSRRYFVERTFEDAKTEIGWDEFCAQKYRAWEHHLALTGAALWFVAQTKLEWAEEHARDRNLARQLEVELLPALSTANLRELMKAVLPLPQLTPQQATELVITHLVNRARSTGSRLRSQVKQQDSS